LGRGAIKRKFGKGTHRTRTILEGGGHPILIQRKKKSLFKKEGVKENMPSSKAKAYHKKKGKLGSIMRLPFMKKSRKNDYRIIQGGGGGSCSSFSSSEVDGLGEGRKEVLRNCNLGNDT